MLGIFERPYRQADIMEEGAAHARRSELSSRVDASIAESRRISSTWFKLRSISVEGLKTRAGSWDVVSVCRKKDSHELCNFNALVVLLFLGRSLFVFIFVEGANVVMDWQKWLSMYEKWRSGNAK